LIYFLIVIQQLIASSTHIIGQDASTHASPTFVLLLRASIAAVALWAFAAYKEKVFNLFRGLVKKDVWMLIFLGFLNILINQFLFLEGLRYTTPANSALLYALTPAIVFLLVLLIHRERTTLKKTLGVLVALVGVCILIFERGVSLDSSNTKGNLMIFTAMVAWSLFTLLGRPLVQKYGALRVTALHMMIGALIYLPIGLYFSSMNDLEMLTPLLWADIVYLGLISSAVNYALWYYALGKLETSKVAIFQNLQPIMTTILALSLGKVVLTPELIGGGVLALAGVLLVEYS
jgi:drug/metabolite transporter (DMT)-like permease